MLKNGTYYIENMEDIRYLREHPEQKFFVSLKNDTAFRGTMSQESVLRGFIAATLGIRQEDIVGVKLNPTHLIPRYVMDKEGILDVAADIRMPEGEIRTNTIRISSC